MGDASCHWLHLSTRDSIAQHKEKLLTCTLHLTCTRSIPYANFEDPSFQTLFDPFHCSYAYIVTSSNCPSISCSILEPDEFAKALTGWGLDKLLKSTWSQHITTSLTIEYCHFLDFKVSEESISGETVFEGQRDFLSLNTREGTPFASFAVTDITGSVGNLESYYQDNNFERG